jgi:hypothetical protein
MPLSDLRMKVATGFRRVLTKRKRLLLGTMLACTAGFLGGGFFWEVYTWLACRNITRLTLTKNFSLSQVGLEEKYYFESDSRDKSSWTLSARPHAPMNLFAILHYKDGAPGSILDEEVIGDIVAGKNDGYAIRLRMLNKRDCPVELSRNRFLRVSIITRSDEEICYEDLSGDGVFDVRREFTDDMTTRIELNYMGDWVLVDGVEWSGDRPLVLAGSQETLMWDGDQWSVRE